MFSVITILFLLMIHCNRGDLPTRDCHDRQITVRRCEGQSMVLLQLKDPLEMVLSFLFHVSISSRYDFSCLKRRKAISF